MSRTYYLRRLGQTVFVFFAAVTLVFFMYRLLPFGPVEILRARFLQQAAEAGETLTSEDMEWINRQIEIYVGINPSEPLYVSYYKFWRDILLYQDFGRSIYYQENVFKMLFARMPWSVFISVYGLALGTTTSLLFGAVMAYNEGSKFDKGLTVFTIINTTIPYYITAIALIIIFGFGLGWFPIGGRFNHATTPGFNYPYMAGVVHHGALPIISLFVAGFGGALAYRGNCIRELGKDYIRVAKLRGVGESRLALRYVGRNALLPIYTGIMLGIAGIFGSGVIIEVIFDYQAVGLLTYQALLSRDFPLLMGAFMFFTAITLTGILIADLTYGIIDPRVAGGDQRESY